MAPKKTAKSRGASKSPANAKLVNAVAKAIDENGYSWKPKGFKAPTKCLCIKGNVCCAFINGSKKIGKKTVPKKPAPSIWDKKILQSAGINQGALFKSKVLLKPHDKFFKAGKSAVCLLPKK